MKFAQLNPVGLVMNVVCSPEDDDTPGKTNSFPLDLLLAQAASGRLVALTPGQLAPTPGQRHNGGTAFVDDKQWLTGRTAEVEAAAAETQLLADIAAKQTARLVKDGADAHPAEVQAATEKQAALAAAALALDAEAAALAAKRDAAPEKSLLSGGKS